MRKLAPKLLGIKCLSFHVLMSARFMESAWDWIDCTVHNAGRGWKGLEDSAILVVETLAAIALRAKKPVASAPPTGKGAFVGAGCFSVPFLRVHCSM